MTDGSKEWVTIKIPEAIRDDARDDPRTYGQVMRAGLENEPFAEDGGPEAVIEEVVIEESGSGGVSPEDVKGIIERWMERNADRLRRGEI